MFIKDRKLHSVSNFLGIKPEQEFVSTVELKPGKYILGMEFTRIKAGRTASLICAYQLYVNDQVVAEGPMKTQPGKFASVRRWALRRVR